MRGSKFLTRMFFPVCASCVKEQCNVPVMLLTFVIGPLLSILFTHYVLIVPEVRISVLVLLLFFISEGKLNFTAFMMLRDVVQ